MQVGFAAVLAAVTDHLPKLAGLVGMASLAGTVAGFWAVGYVLAAAWVIW